MIVAGLVVRQRPHTLRRRKTIVFRRRYTQCSCMAGDSTRVLRSHRILVLAGIVALGCSDPVVPLPAGIAITPHITTLGLGDTLRLTATVTDRTGKQLGGAPVTWASSDTAVLSVSADGLLRARDTGRATISARAGTEQDALDIAVAIRFVKVASQGGVDCAITTAGAAYCRGPNWFGELGNGSTDSSATFVPVAGGLRFATVLPGIESTCALATDSLAYCWGLGEFGSLGTGDTLNRLVPTPVTDGLRFVALAKGDFHSCGLTPAGATYCWGLRLAGQTIDRTKPVQVSGAPPFVALAAGGSANCGLTATDAALCWGANGGPGTLGYVTDTIFHDPVAVIGGQAFQWLSLREPDCGLSSAGSVYCWAVNDLVSPTAQPLPSGATFTSISTAPYSHVCGTATDNGVYCWWPRGTPTPVPGSLAFTHVASGTYHDCGLTADSAASCWLFHCGTSFDVVCNDAPVPLAVPGSTKFVQLASGADNDTCGLAADGSVSCWWVSRDSSTTPLSMPGSIRFRAISVAEGVLTPSIPPGDYGCGIATDSTGYCWGFQRANLPGGAAVWDPVPVPGGHVYLSLDTYSGHLCGVVASGDAYCWSQTDPAPVLVPGGRTFVSVATSWQSNCALAADGTASCWGYNTYGQLGIGFSSSQSLVPLPVTGGHAFTALAVAYDHSCGLAPDSTAYCWGSNRTGDLGTGDTVSSIAPVAVAGGRHFGSLVTGQDLTCGLVADGSAYCWGLGMLDPAVQQPGIRFTNLSPSIYARVCGATSNGEALCWAMSGAPAPPRAARRR
jgi:alpha-tubulin suppressor-like RCC1 family protein